MPKKLELIPHWKMAWRFVSVQLGALAVALQTFLTTYPNAALDAWSNLPPDIKGYLPPTYLQYVSGFLMVLAIGARVINQPKTQEKIAVKMAVEAAEPPKENTASQSSTLPLSIFGALLLLGAVSNTYAGEVTVTCTKPTTNTDGTPLTDLGGIRYLWGKTETDFTGTTYVDGTGPCSYVVKNLTGGKWYFAVRAYKTNGIESENSPVVSKDVLALPTGTIPKPPLVAGATVSNVEVFQVIGTIDAFQLLPVGTVPPTTVCIPTQSVNGYYGVPNESVAWYGNVRPKIVVAKCD